MVIGLTLLPALTLPVYLLLLQRTPSPAHPSAPTYVLMPLAAPQRAPQAAGRGRAAEAAPGAADAEEGRVEAQRKGGGGAEHGGAWLCVCVCVSGGGVSQCKGFQCQRGRGHEC